MWLLIRDIKPGTGYGAQAADTKGVAAGTTAEEGAYTEAGVGVMVMVTVGAGAADLAGAEAEGAVSGETEGVASVAGIREGDSTFSAGVSAAGAIMRGVEAGRGAVATTPIIEALVGAGNSIHMAPHFIFSP